MSGYWKGSDSDTSRIVVSLSLMVLAAAINGFLIANLIDLVQAFVALASLILIVLAVGYLVGGLMIIPEPDESGGEPSTVATRSPRSVANPSITIGALVTVNILLILAAALGATRLVVEGRGRHELVRKSAAGQIVYRVWGDGPGDCPAAPQFGRFWSPVDPRSYGSRQFRVLAGLPDRCNSGQYLTFGTLDSATSPTITWAAAVEAGPSSAFCSYPGGLVEYVIDDARAHVLPVGTVELDPDYGGDPGACPGKG